MFLNTVLTNEGVTPQIVFLFWCYSKIKKALHHKKRTHFTFGKTTLNNTDNSNELMKVGW